VSHPPTGITPDTLLQGGSPFDFQGVSGEQPRGLAAEFLDALRGTGDDPADGGSECPLDYSAAGLVGIPNQEYPGGPCNYQYIRDPTFGQGVPGGGSPQFRPGELALLQAELAEQKRTNLAQEALATRRITLDRALNSLTAFNTAQDIADQRRLSAVDQARQLAGFLTPKGTEFFPGMEPTGALAQVSQTFGLPFGGAPVVEQEFDVGALAQPGPVSPQVSQMLAGIGRV
jgi:hypothetical protein